MSNHITITDDNTNEIIKTMVCWPEYQSLQAGTNQTIHKGRFSKLEYTYDGTGFTKFATSPTETPENKFIKIERAMKAAGLHTSLSVPNINTRASCKDAIDLAADSAKTRIVSKGIYISDEYRIVFEQVKAWRAAGSPANNMPRAITDDWIVEKGITPEQAAVEIEQAGQGFIDALLDLRNIRLKGKAAVDNATPETFKSVAQQYLNQLESI